MGNIAHYHYQGTTMKKTIKVLSRFEKDGVTILDVIIYRSVGAWNLKIYYLANEPEPEPEPEPDEA